MKDRWSVAFVEWNSKPDLKRVYQWQWDDPCRPTWGIILLSVATFYEDDMSLFFLRILCVHIGIRILQVCTGRRWITCRRRVSQPTPQFFWPAVWQEQVMIMSSIEEGGVIQRYYVGGLCERRHFHKAAFSQCPHIRKMRIRNRFWSLYEQ